jgi:hypothetical protein
MARDKLDTPFERLFVRYSATGGTRVEWYLHRLFTDPLPHTFQLQGAYGAVATAAWEDIGLPADNTFYLVDDEQRNYGKTHDWHLRVKLTTAKKTYYSKAASAQENLNFRDWRLSTEMVRKERFRLTELVGVDGYLLKRKRYGTKCTRCTDRLTDEVTDSDCPTCNGTGVLEGYYAAVPNFFVEIPQRASQEQMDGVQMVGTTNPLIYQGCRVLGEPLLDSYDVFVDKTSDTRYVVRAVQEAAVWRGYPIATTVTLHQLPFTDRAYKIPLEGT